MPNMDVIDILHDISSATIEGDIEKIRNKIYAHAYSLPYNAIIVDTNLIQPLRYRLFYWPLTSGYQMLSRKHFMETVEYRYKYRTGYDMSKNVSMGNMAVFVLTFMFPYLNIDELKTILKSGKIYKLLTKHRLVPDHYLIYYNVPDYKGKSVITETDWDFLNSMHKLMLTQIGLPYLRPGSPEIIGIPTDSTEDITSMIIYAALYSWVQKNVKMIIILPQHRLDVRVWLWPSIENLIIIGQSGKQIDRILGTPDYGAHYDLREGKVYV